MANDYFQFKQFTIRQAKAAMKVTTDSCVFGAWCASVMEQDVITANTRMLDIGTGTGLLSLMCAQKNDLLIDAVEVEKDSAEQARENIAASIYKEKINLIHENILRHDGTAYDYIVCNPPFYENELASPEEAKNIAHHSSLLLWKDLFPLILQKLATGGSAFLLLPSSRANHAYQLLEQLGLFPKKEVFLCQSEGRQPFRHMICVTTGFTVRSSDSIAIRENKGEYSAAFKSLLKDYYLHL